MRGTRGRGSRKRKESEIRKGSQKIEDAGGGEKLRGEGKVKDGSMRM